MVVIERMKEKIKIRKLNKEFNFKKIAQEWLEYKKSRIKVSTYCNYLFKVEKYLYPKFEYADIRKIKNYDNITNEFMKELSVKTVRDIMAIFKAILIFYEKQYNKNLHTNQLNLPKNGRSKIKVLNNKETRRLERHCLKINTLKSLGIVVCLNTGLRIGEICALKWEDIDLDREVICVKNTLQRIYKKMKTSLKY